MEMLVMVMEMEMVRGESHNQTPGRVRRRAGTSQQKAPRRHRLPRAFSPFSIDLACTEMCPSSSSTHQHVA